MLQKILKEIFEDSEASSSMHNYDFSHIPAKEGEASDTTGKEALNKPTDVEEINAVDDSLDKPEKTIRVLSIDKRKCNRQFKDLVEQETYSAIPIKRIKEILKTYDLQLVDQQYRFVGRSGNADLEMINTKGIPISNSALVIYWNRKDGSVFDLNIYLS